MALRMSKSASQIIKFSIIALIVLLLPLSSFGESYRILSTQHKFRPQKSSLAAVKASIISSYQPVAKNSPALLNRASHTKRKPVRTAAISNRSFRKRLSARSAIVMDAKTGRTLYAHAPDRPGQPASTVKVLTGLLAMDYLKNNSLVPVSSWAASMPRSKIYIRKGKSYYANDMINAVLLASANDASVALAEKVAGSETAFARMMTQKARQLGAQKTIIKTASGLTAKGQQTTARDLAVIFNKAMKHKEFASRIKRTKVKTSYGKTLRSHNKAMWQISGSEGGKTGYTWAARQTYVGKFKRNNREIVVALLGSRNMWTDIARLVDYGFDSHPSIQLADTEGSSSGKSSKSQTSYKSAFTVLSDNKKVAKL
jgi:D-alanyl-D-alanine carboxypeptidase (penicillin-binding protein 5/6)